MPPLSYAIAAAVATVALVLLARPRRFYIIRHGQTLLNSEHIRQGEDGALSEKGQRQAEQVGRFLERFPIKQIISSTYPRAKETAAILNTHLRVPVRYSSLFTERRNPTEIVGKRTDDPDVERIVDKIDYSYHEDEFRFSDEENFIDLKERARKCLWLLMREWRTETVIVTHHLFLKMLVAYMLYHDRLHAADFTKLTFFNTSDNAGITVCEFHPWKILSKTHGWEIVSYNEQPETE